MTVNQISVFLENKPGHLEEVLRVLKAGGINIITLTIAETTEYGLLRMIVDKPEAAADALQKANITCSVTAVLAVEIEDKPGSLLAAIQSFKKRHLNIEYLYTFAEKQRPDRIVVIFRFEDIETAKEAVQQDGYPLVTHHDITGE